MIFFQIGVLKNFALFTGKWRPPLQHRCFTVDIGKFPRIAFF